MGGPILKGSQSVNQWFSSCDFPLARGCRGNDAIFIYLLSSMATAASRRFRHSQSNTFYRDLDNFSTVAVHETKIKRCLFLICRMCMPNPQLLLGPKRTAIYYSVHLY